MMAKNDPVVLELDRPRVLHFRFGEMRRLKTSYGIDATKLNLREADLEEYPKILFVMLQQDAEDNGEELTLQKVENLMDLAEMGDVLYAMSLCTYAAFTPAAAGDKEPVENPMMT